jgi:predicted Zn-dependent protease
VFFTGRFVLRGVHRGSFVAIGLVAYAVQSLFLFPIAELEPVAWLLAGIVVAGVARREEQFALEPPRAVPAIAGAAAAVTLVAGVLDVAADRDARTTLAAVAADRPVGRTRADHLRPDALRYRLVAAQALEATGTADGLRRAVHVLDEGLAYSPRDPVVRGERARLLLVLAQTTGSKTDAIGARQAFDRLLRDDPRNAAVLLRAGVARALAGDPAGAESAWLAAERLAPTSPAASVDLALAYAHAGRWADARAAARRALVRDPHNQQAMAVLKSRDGT